MMGAIGVMFLVVTCVAMWQQFRWAGFWLWVLMMFAIAWWWE